MSEGSRVPNSLLTRLDSGRDHFIDESGRVSSLSLFFSSGPSGTQKFPPCLQITLGNLECVYVRTAALTASEYEGNGKREKEKGKKKIREVVD